MVGRWCRDAATGNEFIDIAEAERLHAALRTALAKWDDLNSEQRRILSEAVRYFVRTDDEENDQRSPIGFEDDAIVVDAAVLRLNQISQAGKGSEPRPT